MKNFPWIHAVMISRAILRDRSNRRIWLGRFALLLVIFFALGTTLFDPWLSESIWRFAFFWFFMLLWILLVIIFALYDALSVIREERERMK